MVRISTYRALGGFERLLLLFGLLMLFLLLPFTSIPPFTHMRPYAHPGDHALRLRSAAPSIRTEVGSRRASVDSGNLSSIQFGGFK